MVIYNKKSKIEYNVPKVINDAMEDVSFIGFRQAQMRIRFGKLIYCVVFTSVWLMIQMPSVSAKDKTSDIEILQAMVDADWSAQEHRKGRTADTPEAIRDIWQSANKLLTDLRRMPESQELSLESAALEQLRSQVHATDSLDKKARLVLYRKVRSVARSLALKNPLIASKPIVFMKRRRFICQMLHEYLGYFYD